MSTGEETWEVKVMGNLPKNNTWTNIALRWEPLKFTDATSYQEKRQELESSLQVSVGGCGMWGVAKDNSLWFRVGTAGRTAEWAGDNWTKVRILTSTMT